VKLSTYEKLEFNRSELPEACPSGKVFEDCPASTSLLARSAIDKPDRVLGSWPRHWNHLQYLSRNCGRCALKCAVAIETEDEQRQTGEVSISYSAEGLRYLAWKVLKIVTAMPKSGT
jgi:hypothetical protein